MPKGCRWIGFVFIMALSVLGFLPATVAAQAPTTGTLTLRTGKQVGEYTIGDKLTFRVRILRPDVNRDLPLTQSTPRVGRLVLSSDRGEIRLAMIDKATVAGDFSLKAATNALAVVEVSSTDTSSSPTLLFSAGGASVSDGAGPVIFQMDGRSAYKSLTKDGFRIVAPLRPGEPLRLGIGRVPMDMEALKALDLSSAPESAPRDRETALSMAPDPGST